MRDGRDSNTPAYHSLPLSVFPDVQNVLNICCRFYVAWDEEEEEEMDGDRERGPTIIIHTKTQANAIILLRGTGNATRRRKEMVRGGCLSFLSFSLSLSLNAPSCRPFKDPALRRSH